MSEQLQINKEKKNRENITFRVNVEPNQEEGQSGGREQGQSGGREHGQSGGRDLKGLRSQPVGSLDTVGSLNLDKWDAFDFCPELLRGIYAHGFEKPSQIQQLAIKPLMDGRHMIAQAQSGTGKTGAFTIGLLHRLDLSQNTTQAIILAPTHELVTQITNVLTAIGQMMPGLVVQTLVGGTSTAEDAEKLRKTPPHVIVGTAGRTYDMIRRRNIQMRTVKLFIMDEADEMLSRGFRDQIDDIFKCFNPEPGFNKNNRNDGISPNKGFGRSNSFNRTGSFNRIDSFNRTGSSDNLANATNSETSKSQVQVVLFSATMPLSILQMTNTYMQDPVHITVEPEKLNLDGIEQYYVALENDSAKFNTLKDLFGLLSIEQCIIYCNSVPRVVDLYDAMIAEGYSVCCIHSSMNHDQRKKTMTDFRTGTFRVLISSDITSRGIDVQQVSMVINFDVPSDIHNYLHRIGRSGRWGRKGRAINFVTRRDVDNLRNIERYYKSTIVELPASIVENKA